MIKSMIIVKEQSKTNELQKYNKFPKVKQSDQQHKKRSRHFILLMIN
jgi:predicted ABC-type exoprotein transport system permease subunit